MNWNVASIEWDLKQDEALQQVQAAMQDSLTLGSYVPADLLIAEVLVTDSNIIWNLWQTPI